MPETYTEEFEFAGKHIRAECEYIPGEAENLIRDHIRKDDFAMAEVTVLVSSVRKLELDGKVEYRNSTRAARRGNTNASTHFPRLRDDETYQSLSEKLLGVIVSTREIWLAKKEPFDEVFDMYLDEKLSETSSGKDPTPFRAVSGDQSG
jgi:hypothetical protein